jgi:hypothetical protein
MLHYNRISTDTFFKMIILIKYIFKNCYNLHALNIINEEFFPLVYNVV